MYIEDCTKKEIFGTFDRNKLPANLTQYQCELCIEQYEQGKTYEEIRYFRFTPRAGIKGSPFDIMIDTIVKPKSPIFLYNILQNSEKQSVDVALGNQVQLKFQTTVKQPVNIEPNMKELSQPDSQGEFNFRDIDQDTLRQKFKLAQSPIQDERSEPQSKYPEQGDSSSIKTELIKYLKTQGHAKTTVGQIKQYLNSRGHRISEAGVKSILKDICEDSEPDKKTGYVLKQYYLKFYDNLPQKNPKKKLKDE